jgi:diaminopimelate decarboxylase
MKMDTLLPLARQHGTPLFVYFCEEINRQTDQLLALDMPYGYTPRYAMKANPHPEIVKHIVSRGVGVDASSSYEAEQAIQFGVPPDQIALTSQQSAHNLKELVEQGVTYHATSLHQLELYGRVFPNTTVGVRINPGVGSGHSQKTNVGGPTSSFGIWHDYIDDIKAITKRYNLTINKVHTHVGSGTDLAIWKEAVDLSLVATQQFEDCAIINLGGGFKVARMPDEVPTPIDEVASVISQRIKQFKQKTGTELHVELEPGGFLVAGAGVLLAEIDDIVDTGEGGYTFIKLNTGMNDILRPSLYAAQHRIEVLTDRNNTKEYAVVGHNCESGDLLTPAIGDPETIATRELTEAQIGDIVAVGDVGAYCASMAAHGYNGFPSAKEVVVRGSR